VEWHRCSPHATDCAFRYTVQVLVGACYTSWVQTIPYRAAAVRPRQLPGQNRITGRLLAAEHSSAQGHWSPSVTVRQSLPAA
jgi:hypothetical protein